MSEVRNKMPTRTIRKNKHAEPFSSGKIRHLDNFKTAMGMGANWIDLDSGIMYHIQEYYELLHDPKVSKESKPTKIKMTNYKTGELIGYADEYEVAERIKDPKPDPRY